MTPRRMLPWGSADEFRAPRLGGMTQAQAAAKIAAEFGAALSLLASETAAAFGIPPGLQPLSWWFRVGDEAPRCGPCDVVVEVGPELFRCPSCGRVASKPPGWSS